MAESRFHGYDVIYQNFRLVADIRKRHSLTCFETSTHLPEPLRVCPEILVCYTSLSLLCSRTITGYVTARIPDSYWEAIMCHCTHAVAAFIVLVHSAGWLGAADDPIIASDAGPILLQEHGAGEGPAWDPKLGLLTSGEGHINRRDRAGKSSVYRENAGSNGLMFDRQGRLVICEPVRRRVSRLEADGQLTILTDKYEGKRYNQPNDLTIDSQNRLYFSDPRYGDRADMEIVDDSGRKVEGVYRIDPDGTVTRIITHEVDRPNGLVVSHDDQYLFVADNNNNDVGGARKLWRFHLQPDGNIAPASRTLVHDWGTTRGPDGMKLDAQGRLFVAAGINKPNLPAETAEKPTAGIYVFSPEGKLLQMIPIPRDETTNCAFGGDDLKTLFVTAGGTLWSIRVKTPGQPAWPLLTPSPVR